MNHRVLTSTKIPLETSRGRNYEAPPWCYVLWLVPALTASAAGSAYQKGAIPLEAAGLVWAASVGWIGVGCFINGRSCGRVHCKVDGYLFPPLAVVGALNALSVVSFSWNLYWGVFFAILVASFVPELTWRRYLPRLPGRDPAGVGSTPEETRPTLIPSPALLLPDLA